MYHDDIRTCKSQIYHFTDNFPGHIMIKLSFQCKWIYRISSDINVCMVFRDQMEIAHTIPSLISVGPTGFPPKT